MKEIVKHYDKQIFKTEKILKIYIIIIISFSIGFISGYFAVKNQIKEAEVINNEIQIHNTL